MARPYAEWAESATAGVASPAASARAPNMIEIRFMGRTLERPDDGRSNTRRRDAESCDLAAAVPSN
ncbi:hypothetical protein GCM10023194_46330 [Planotetraspora phitsanulokensis]|uniref:Uncharacterized protein n=1 Tax=Planotetraspora phitsanulokensis TaxID=575192 RepID=A0A8J3XGP7_9ACTN|nr:hypothetical protein Pph01_60800 [Planotetraspora phitsanulokensis]